MDALKKIAESKAGKAGAVIVLIAATIFIYRQFHGIFGESQAAAIADDRIFICSETGKSFHVNLAKLEGQSFPVMSPYTGKRTGYPAELCYWTKDGHVKSDPTPVLLNSFLGKSGPTFCPDCGRLVVAHNPVAMDGETPPPTKEEWMQSHGNR